MSKQKAIFICSECGCECLRWLGRCPDCGEYNTLFEQATITRPARAAGRPRAGAAAQPVPITGAPGSPARLLTGIAEFDRVLGQGLVAGSVVLLAGDPGVGKSTILLQACMALAQKGAQVLYISAEESVHQVHARAKRLGDLSETLLVAAETEIALLEGQIETVNPSVVIIDSIQTVSDAELGSAPGTVSQVRQCASRLIHLAKEHDRPTILVGHVTKEGTVAGPRLLEHMVDTVLYLEGERHLGYRVLRSHKNRFGSTDEVGIFEMTEMGLVEVADPSGAFLSQHTPGAAGTALCVVIEGTRPLLVEAQGLITKAYGPPRRASSGPDYNRMHLILAVLERHLRIPLSSSDVFVNIPGGLRIGEPAADLAIAMSLVSAHREKPLPEKTVCIGEIGLTGEIRGVSRLERRLAEATRLGMTRAIVPAKHTLRNFSAAIDILSIESLQEAVTSCMMSNRPKRGRAIK